MMHTPLTGPSFKIFSFRSDLSSKIWLRPAIEHGFIVVETLHKLLMKIKQRKLRNQHSNVFVVSNKQLPFRTNTKPQIYNLRRRKNFRIF